jgi:hypothetical protein
VESKNALSALKLTGLCGCAVGDEGRDAQRTYQAQPPTSRRRGARAGNVKVIDIFGNDTTSLVQVTVG